jgi:hypothetical protein
MTTTGLASPAYKVIGQHPTAEVWLNTSTNQHSLHASIVFQAGNVVADFGAGTVQQTPSYLTVQISTDRHITLVPEFLQYVNHSCDPNVFFDTTAMQLVCLKPIQPGEEMRFFYPGAEWEMAQPFVCNCGSSNCLQLINGASHLSEETLASYRLTDYIQWQLKQKA